MIHVGVRASNLDETIHFWRDLLGLRVVDQGESHYDLTDGAHNFRVFQHDGPKRREHVGGMLDYLHWENHAPLFTGVPSHKEALEWIMSYVDKYGADVKASSSGFINETVALHIDSTSHLKDYPNQNPDLRCWVQPVPHPEGLKSITYSSGAGMAIPRGSKNPEAALKFILFMLQPDTRVDLYRMARALPPHMDGVRAIAPYVTDPREKVMVDQLFNAYTPVPLLRTVQGHWRDLTASMRNHEITPDHVLMEMQRALVPEYNKAFGR